MIACYKDNVLSDYYNGDDTLYGVITWEDEWHNNGDDEMLIISGESFPISLWESGSDMIQFKWSQEIEPQSTSENGIEYSVECW